MKKLNIEANGSFTLSDAFSLQEQSMREWRGVLTDEAYAKLVECQTRENAKGVRTPYDVWRGQYIDLAVHTIAHA